MKRYVAILIALLTGSGWAAGATETVLHAFQAHTDGFYPTGTPLVADPAGNLYGTTLYGGNGNCKTIVYPGCGVIFQLANTTTGFKYKVIYSFQSGSDGAFPSQVAVDPAGNVYGAASFVGSINCGPASCGTIFKLSPPSSAGSPWIKTVIYQFQGGADGFAAVSLIADHSGNLYGATSTGGSGGACGTGGCGTVFKLTPPVSGATWTKTTLHSFQGVARGTPVGDGSDPLGIAFDSQGNLLGATISGGYCQPFEGGVCFGSVFKLTAPSWSYALLYRFTQTDQQVASVPVDDSSGAVFGTTELEVYELTMSSGKVTRTILASLPSPYGGVILDPNGNLLGTTLGGGTTNHGTIYRLNRPTSGSTWTETVLYSFAGSPDGDAPDAPMLLLHAGTLYGTTLRGGSQGCQFYSGDVGCGTVFQFVP